MSHQPSRSTYEPCDATQLVSPDRFSRLPIELLLEVASYLPVSASISMKLVNKSLYLAITIARDYDLYKLSPCDRNAARRAINERKHLLAGRKWCLICKTPQPLHRFPQSVAICSFHQRRFKRGLVPCRVDDQLRSVLIGVGETCYSVHSIGKPRVLCMHCHTLQWRDEKGCWCVCDCCPRVIIKNCNDVSSL